VSSDYVKHLPEDSEDRKDSESKPDHVFENLFHMSWCLVLSNTSLRSPQYRLGRCHSCQWNHTTNGEGVWLAWL